MMVQASGHDAVGRLRESGVKAEIEVLQFDVTNDDYILAAAKHIQSKIRETRTIGKFTPWSSGHFSFLIPPIMKN